MIYIKINIRTGTIISLKISKVNVRTEEDACVISSQTQLNLWVLSIRKDLAY